MELSAAAIVFAVAYLYGLGVGYYFGRMHGRYRRSRRRWL